MKTVEVTISIGLIHERKMTFQVEDDATEEEIEEQAEEVALEVFDWGFKILDK